MTTHLNIANVSAASSRTAVSPVVKTGRQTHAVTRGSRVQRIELERRDRFGRFGRR